MQSSTFAQFSLFHQWWVMFLRIAASVMWAVPVLAGPVVAQENQRIALADILIAAASVQNDQALLDVLAGLRAGLAGKKVAADAAWEQVFLQAETKRSPAVRQKVVLLGVDLGHPDCVTLALQAVASDQQPATWRKQLVQALSAKQVAGFAEPLLDLLDDEELSLAAIRGLASFDDPRIPPALLLRWAEWGPDRRRAALQVLASRTSFALALCDAMEQGSVARQEVPVFTARQMMSLGDDTLRTRLSQVWGDLRGTSGERLQEIRRYQNLLVAEVLDQADLANGQSLTKRVCLTCHLLHGVGESIGPDMTGSQRGDLHYLLHNIVNPSAEIDRSMRLTILHMLDGRVLTGIVTSENEHALRIRTLNEEVAVDKSSIEKRQLSEQSMMPDGLLAPLSNDEVRDLIGFLMRDKREAP